MALGPERERAPAREPKSVARVSACGQAGRPHESQLLGSTASWSGIRAPLSKCAASPSCPCRLRYVLSHKSPLRSSSSVDRRAALVAVADLWRVQVRVRCCHVVDERPTRPSDGGRRQTGAFNELVGWQRDPRGCPTKRRTPARRTRAQRRPQLPALPALPPFPPSSPLYSRAHADCFNR